MKRMINLRHIEIGCTPLDYLPQGIGKLVHVQTLDQFIVGGPGGGCDIGELKYLNLLEGSLNIRGLETVATAKEADEAELKKKQYVHTLILNFTSEYMSPELDHTLWRNHRDLSETSILGEKMEGVLQGLEPHPNLERLYIYYYPGVQFPSWMNGSSLLCNLLHLELRDCMNCTELPGLGQLPFLKVLRISNLNKLSNIGLEFYSITGGSFTNEATFSKLKELHIFNIESLEEWDLREHPDCKSLTEMLNISHMPCLNMLSLEGCPNLKNLPFHLPDTLHELKIQDCPELTWPTVAGFGICNKVSITGDAGVFSRSLSLFPNIKYLKIEAPPNSILPDGLSQVKDLQSLTLWFCHSLMYVPKELEHLTMFQELKICLCPHLEPRCSKDNEEDWNIISHIPNIIIIM